MLLLEPLLSVKVITLDGVYFDLVRASDDQTLYWRFAMNRYKNDSAERMTVRLASKEFFSRRERLIEAPPERNHIRKIEHYLYEYREEDLQ